MRDFVFTIILFSSLLYFSFASILGVDMSDGAGGAYKAYCIVCFLAFIIIYTRFYIKRAFSRKHLTSLLILFVYIIVGVISGYANDKSFLCLVAFCFPASGIAIYYAENKNIGNIVKWIDVILPFVSISLFFSLTRLLIGIREGDSYYSQTLSYDAAYCFVLCLFLLLFGERFNRFAIFKTKTYQYLCFFLLLYYVLIMFFSGGRGALGTLLVGSFLLIYYFKKYKGFNVSKVIRYVAVVSIIIVSFMFLYDSDNISILTNNFNRVFSFFNTEADMYERTSGRDEVLQSAFQQIAENPIIGSGLFSYKESFFINSEQHYPHNIFVEVLLQGGLCLFFVLIFVLLNAFVKFKKMLKDISQLVILPFVVFSMTLLMYSGSYMETPFFWFSLIYVFNYRFTWLQRRSVV